MTTMIDFPDLDAAIDAEAWQWLQEAAPVYADAITAEVKRGHEPGDIRRRFMRLTQRQTEPGMPCCIPCISRRWRMTRSS